MMFTLTNYWWLLIWLILAGLFVYIYVPLREEEVLGDKKLRWQPLAAFILVLPLIVWAAYRSQWVGDTSNYINMFEQVPTGLSQLPSYLDSLTKDKGFYALAMIFKTVVGNHHRIFFLLLSSFQLGMMAYIYRKYSSDYWVSIFLFIASGDYISYCFNGIRQFTAVTIILGSFIFILEKKYIQSVLLVLLAYTFHGSALLMLPAIFIVQGEAWNMKSVLFILVAIAVLVYVNQFTDLLDDMLSTTSYSNMVTDWKEWNDNGTNPIRVLIYSLPMLISIVGYPQIKAYNDNYVNILVNFSILTTGIALISMVTSGIFIGRLIIYPAIFSNFLLLPWEVNHLFTDKTTRLVRVMMIIGYIGLFYYQMHLTWGLI